MSAVLRVSAIAYASDLPKNTLEKGTLRLPLLPSMKDLLYSGHTTSEPECPDACECVLRKSSFPPIRDSTDPATLAGNRVDRMDGYLFKRKRSHSNETGSLRVSSGRETTSSHGGEPMTEPCQRSVSVKEVSCLDHCAIVDAQDYERNQRREPGTMELQYTKPFLVCKDIPRERSGTVHKVTRDDRRCDQIQAKKRRSFAGRTRTGCRTCRKRKKKCDEAKPKYRNCLRGNFECAGYIEDIPPSKKNASLAAPALSPQRQMSTAEATACFGGSPVLDVIPKLLYESGQMIHVETTASSRIIKSRDKPVRTAEPGLQISKPSLWYEACSQPHQHPYRPPASPRPHSLAAEHRAQQSPSQTVPHVSTVTTQLLEHTTLVSSAPPDEACSDGHDANRSLQSSLPAPVPQPALSVFHRTHPSLSPKSEKNKMLSEEPFLPNAAQLIDERDLSSQALFRFNTAMLKDLSERAWLFKRIIAAEWIYPREGECQATGYLGNGVKVTAPFHCEYGYNLSIGDNAVLGPGCQLLDSGRIVIGRNTKIGARVTISTLKEPIETKPTTGSERTETAREVYIGENAYIGDGCIVKSGVRVGDNTIVHAGSIVDQDVPANCIVFGNPAKARQVDWGF